jgi:hypothetical protein
MDARGIPPTYPFHMAKAYAAAMPAARPVPSRGAPVGVDSVELSKPRAASIGGLVAGKVAVTPNFAAPPAPSNSDALPMYRHPADKNAAATSVSLGRAVDLNA